MHDTPDLIESTRRTLARIAADFSPAVFASSLAAEDMVLTDLILRNRLPIGIFSLDTGRRITWWNARPSLMPTPPRHGRRRPWSSPPARR